MDIMKWVIQNLNYNDKAGKLFITFLYFILSVLFFILAYQHNINSSMLIVQISHIIIINIWLYTAPKFYSDYKSLNSLFKNSVEYKKECKDNEQRVCIFNYQNNNWCLNMGKIVYSIFWGLLTFFSLVFAWNLFSNELIYDKIFLIFLICISMFLNYSSYYTSMMNTFFYRQISNLHELEYNVFVPSATYEFVKLKKNANKTSIIFLSVALLYDVAYISLLFTKNMPDNYCTILGVNNELLFFIFLIFSILSFFIVFLLPKFFLHRLLYRWKEAALCCFQKELYDAQENDTSKVKTIVQDIERLNNDKVKFGLVNLFEILLIITTIIYNIVFIVNL